MVTETDRNKARSAVVSAYHALDCVTIPFSFLHAFADAAVDAVSTDAEPVAWRGVGSDGVSEVTEREDIAVQWREDGIEVTPLYAEPVKTAPAVAVKADLPERFEEWWAGRDSKGEKTLDYNQRKQLAWDAFYAAALSAQVQDAAVDGADIGRCIRSLSVEHPLKWAEAEKTPILRGWFVGQVMKHFGGKPDEKLVRELIDIVFAMYPASPASKHGDAE